MKTFEPLMTYLSPFFTARVRIEPTSEPASGSVRQNDASLGSSDSIPRNSFLTSSEPPRITGADASPLHISEVPMPEHPQPNSSSIRQPSSVCSPPPAVLLGDLDVHQADLVGLLDDLLRPDRVPVVIPRDGPDLLLGEVVGQLAQVFLLVGEGEVNQGSESPSERATAAA